MVRYTRIHSFFFFPIPLSKTWPTVQLSASESSNPTVFLQQSHISSSDLQKSGKRKQDLDHFSFCLLYFCRKKNNQTSKSTAVWSTSFSFLLVKIQMIKAQRLLHMCAALIRNESCIWPCHCHVTLPLKISPWRTGSFDSNRNFWKGFFRMHCVFCNYLTSISSNFKFQTRGGKDNLMVHLTPGSVKSNLKVFALCPQ